MNREQLIQHGAVSFDDGRPLTDVLRDFEGVGVLAWLAVVSGYVDRFRASVEETRKEAARLPKGEF